MIQVLSSSSIPQEKNYTLQEKVDEALEAIWKHYSDPIHELPQSYPIDCNKNIPPVLQHWVNRLTESTREKNESPNQLIKILFNGYSRWIRPNLFRGGSLAPASNIPITGISVLMHYELLLSKILEQNQAVHSPGRTNPLVLSNFQNKTDPNGNDKKDTHYLQVIASDIALLTKLCVIVKAEEKKGEDDMEEEELERATHSQLVHGDGMLVSVVCLRRLPLSLYHRVYSCYQ